MQPDPNATSRPGLPNAPRPAPVEAQYQRSLSGTGGDASPGSFTDHPEQVPALVCELLFNQLQHLAVIAMAAAGGVLTLLGTTFADVSKKGGVIVAVLAFGLSAFVALMAQNEMVEALAERRPFMKKIKRYRAVAYALLGAGVGAFIQFVSRIIAG